MSLILFNQSTNSRREFLIATPEHFSQNKIKKKKKT